MSGGFFDLPAGRVLGGRYRIERRLAAGGMAAVFEASIVGLGRRVALKTLHPRLSEDRRSIERLRREALTVAGLQHPNIVQIIDFRDAPEEPVFLVMELLEGRTLFDIVQADGPLPWPRVAGIARQLLAGLAVTHEAGLLHRDLKPANVFILPLGGGGDLVKLLDFGLAAVREGPGFEKLTRTGVVVGTPAYMAPEQARGDRIDRRADLYGAGAVLWAALAGRRPFEGRTAGEVLVKVVGEAPPPLLQLRPDLPPAVAAVVERAIAKRPDDRFPDAASMAAALAAVEAGGVGGEADAFPASLVAE